MRYYGKISKCNAKMTNNELNNKYTILYDAVDKFSKKYSIFACTLHKPYTGLIESRST